MHSSNVLWCLCLCALMARPSEQKISYGRLLRLVGVSSDVGDFAEVLQEFFDFGGSTDSSQITGEDLVQRIDASMEASQTNILSSLLETSKLDRIYDTVIAMHSSLLDLRNLVLSHRGPLAGTYKQRFINNYLNSQIIKHLRFLPELLTYIVPGFDIPLLEQLKQDTKCNHTAIGIFRDFYVNLLSDGVGSQTANLLKQNTKCNHTAIGIFRDFYVNLLSDGVGLQAAYSEFTSNVTLDNLLQNEWDSSLRKVQKGFDDIEVRCFDELFKAAHKAQSCPGSSSSGAWARGASWTSIVLFILLVV